MTRRTSARISRGRHVCARRFGNGGAGLGPICGRGFWDSRLARRIAVRPRASRIGGRAMTVRTNHLHAAAIGPEKVWLQVAIVIELNCSQIAVSRAQHGKFGVVAFEARNVARESRRNAMRR